MAAHRKLNQRRDDLFAAGLCTVRWTYQQSGYSTGSPVSFGDALQMIFALVVGVLPSLLDKVFSVREASLVLWNLVFSNPRPTNDK
jgi:hypothetical protein